MTVTRSALTDTDIQMLLKGATADERALAAHKLCRRIDQQGLTPEEREAAQSILRIMAADAAELVRRALAVTLRASPLVPRDVAMALARDVETVSLPILSFSPAFTDDDLAEIVRIGGAVRQVAVAKRPQLSQKVTAAVAEHGVEQAVEAACAVSTAAACAWRWPTPAPACRMTSCGWPSPPSNASNAPPPACPAPASACRWPAGWPS